MLALQITGFARQSPRLPTEAAAQASAVFHVKRFLTDSEIEHVHELSAYVYGLEGDHDLAKRQASPPNTWRTVFINHHLQAMLPDLHGRLFAAARQADAGCLFDPERGQLSFRVCEYSTVLPGGGLRAKFQ